MNSVLGLINQAMHYGYSAKQIINFVSNKFPKLAQGIKIARQNGFDDAALLQYLSNKIPDKSKGEAERQYTANDRYMRSIGLKTKDERATDRAKFAKYALTATAAGMAAYAGYKALQGPQAIQPTSIIVPRRNPPTAPAAPGETINITPRGLGGAPRGLPGGPQRALPAPAQMTKTQLVTSPQPQPPISPRTPTAQAPMKPPMETYDVINLPGPKAKPSDLLSKLKLTQTVDLMSSKNPPDAIAAALEQYFMTPGQKKWLETQTNEPLEIVIERYIAEKPKEQTPIAQPITEIQSAKPIAEIHQEKKIQQTIEKPISKGSIVETPKGEAKIKSLSKKVATVVFNDGKTAQYPIEKIKSLKESKIEKSDFAIPLYKMPTESHEDYKNREIMFNAVEKASKSLLEGKSFLDFPVNPEALKAKGGYSVAEDVLRFMGNIPNIYDPLLDEDEKEELSKGLEIPELAPTEGERDIYGAQMTPNLVWNLLLSVEPRLSKIEKPKAIKGSPIPGQKMGTTEFRRMLTHSVYGVLSGKKITTKLKDKIEKISKASSYADAIVNAFKGGRERFQQEEMQRLMDDDYFLSLFTDEIEDMIKRIK